MTDVLFDQRGSASGNEDDKHEGRWTRFGLLKYFVSELVLRAPRGVLLAAGTRAQNEISISMPPVPVPWEGTVKDRHSRLLAASH